MTQAKHEPRFEHIDISLLIPTPDNPRTVNESSPEFSDLLDSVKRDGVKIPVVVRPHPQQADKYDLRAGARRTKAAIKAGLKVVPALVYETMSDAEAFDITFLENFARQDLQPLEEAKAVAIMLEKHGNDYAVVADKFGKTPHWVHLRSNVSKNLAPEWIKELAKDNSKLIKWTISHLELIARFDRNTQVRFLKDALEQPWHYIDISVKQLEKECNENLRNLKKAGWKLDDVLTDKTGKKLPVCGKCIKRSGCQPGLWDIKEEGGKNDLCLDAACWKNKSMTNMLREVNAKKAQYPNLKLITDGMRGFDEWELSKHLGMPIEGKYGFNAAKKDDKGAFPCYTIGGDSSGKIVWMKSFRSDTSSSSKKDKAKALSLKEKRQQLDNKRWYSVLEKLKSEVGKAAVDAIVHQDLFATVAILVSIYGIYECKWGDNYEGDNKKIARKKYLGMGGFSGSKEEGDTTAALWNMVRPKLIESFHYNGPVTQTPTDCIEAGKEIAALVGIDIDAMFKAACEEIKEPKSWAKLEK